MYATEGSACVGLRSSTHAVLGALKRSVSELSAHQKKILEIDSHVGIGIAGHIVDEGRAPATCVVACARTLDLDDVGTKIAQHLGGPWAGEDS